MYFDCYVKRTSLTNRLFSCNSLIILSITLALLWGLPATETKEKQD